MKIQINKAWIDEHVCFTAKAIAVAFIIVQTLFYFQVPQKIANYLNDLEAKQKAQKIMQLLKNEEEKEHSIDIQKLKYNESFA